MLVRPMLVKGDVIKFGLGGWNSSCDSRFPDENFLQAYPSYNLGSQDSKVVFGMPNPPFNPFTRQTYLLFKTPIRPGDATRFVCPLHWFTAIATDIHSKGPPTQGISKLILMTSPVGGWDPTKITWNTRPVIDPTDPTIIFPQFLKGGEGDDSTVDLVPDQGIQRFCAFDLTKVLKPIVGMVWTSQVISGASVGNSLISERPYQIGPSAGPFYSVLARRADGDTEFNQTRTLYLGPVVANFLLKYSPYSNYINVRGVGPRYNAEFQNVAGAQMTIPNDGVDVAAGAITFSVFDGSVFQEPKTPCKGFVQLLT